MADAALEAELNVIGYTNQAGFLMGAGILELAALNEDDISLEQQMGLASQIKKLTLPHEMGELFKVIGFSKNCDVSLPAFEFRDLREYL
jgi:SAM-dependent MidA family methyltransferase